MVVRIYTKTGDKGETGLYGGKRISKDSLSIEAIGSVDELNSLLGVVVASMQKSKIKNQKYNAKIKNELGKIQSDLFEVGASLANPSAKNVQNLEKRVGQFEELIDQLTKELPELRNFILPGGGEAGSLLHLARSIARRAERKIVALVSKEKIDTDVLRYFNRLSDLLFTMARFVNYKEKKKEVIWIK